MLSEEKIEELRSTLHIAISASDFRAIEAAVLAEQAKQATVWIQSNHLAKVLGGADFLCRISARQLHPDFRPLHPAPVPEGMVKQCEWHHCGDEYMPGTWDGECGAKWTFTEDGPVENNMRFCPECGGEVVIAAAEKEQSNAG